MQDRNRGWACSQQRRHGRSRLRHSVVVGCAALLSVGASARLSAQETTPAERSGASGLDEIVVTARRREESAQTVPVSVTAFSGALLEERNVLTLEDLTYVTPGLRFGAEGGRNNTSISLRGLSQLPIGEGTPAVVTYFSDVPLPGEGVTIPTYDIGSIQVLKGPQGTLFGRNTIGGAVLIYPTAPGYDLEGYGRVGFGNYNYREIEGALNVPLVQDVAAIRVAAQFRKRDGRTVWVGPQDDFDDIDQRSGRLSFLLQPLEGLSNTLIVDYFKSDEQPGADVFIRYNPGVLQGTLGAFGLPPAAAAAYEASLAAAWEQQQTEGGPFRVFSNLDRPRFDRELWGIANTTAWDLGPVTLRNIFGYREVSSDTQIDTDGHGDLSGPLGRLVLFHANSTTEKKYYTEEFQVLGTTDKLDWIVGAFYSKDEPTAGMGSQFQAFSFIDSPTGPVLNFNSSLFENESYAVFAQIGVDLSAWTVEGLTLNLGGRYTWDDVSACGAPNLGGTRYYTRSECEELGATNQLDGIGIVENEGDEATWTVGLDWQVTDELFAYVTSRRGYRSANVNTPIFETPYTTGGTAPQCAFFPSATPSDPQRCADLTAFQKIDGEEVTDYEVGLKANWDAGDINGRTNLALFRTDYKNGIQFFNAVGAVFSNIPDFPNRTSIGVNAADMTIQGAELEFTISPLTGLSLSLNGTYIDQEIDRLVVPPIAGLGLTEDNVTLPTPEFSGSAAVRYVLPTPVFGGELAVNADYYYTDEWDAQAGVSFPSYDLVNARLDLSNIADTGLDVSVWVRNAFDEEYLISPVNLIPAFATNTGMYGDPRMYAVQLTYNFGQ
jgi:iron complex outermembrane recepter protein